MAQVRRYTEAIARGIGVRGLLNVQYALKDDALYVLEANPRASRTVPFVSKATAVPLAKAAARIALGATLAELRAEGMLPATGDGGSLPPDAPIAVKEAVLPFKRFRTPAGKGVDSLLGPEMKSTGEVMGIDIAFGQAFAKSQSAAYGSLPTEGRIFVSVANRDKRGMIFPIKRLADLGFDIVATSGTAEVLRRHGIACEQVPKHYEAGSEDDAVSLILGGHVAWSSTRPRVPVPAPAPTVTRSAVRRSPPTSPASPPSPAPPPPSWASRPESAATCRYAPSSPCTPSSGPPSDRPALVDHEVVVGRLACRDNNFMIDAWVRGGGA